MVWNVTDAICKLDVCVFFFFLLWEDVILKAARNTGHFDMKRGKKRNSVEYICMNDGKKRGCSWGLTGSDNLFNLDKGNIDFLGKLSHRLIRVFVGEGVDVNLDPCGKKRRRVVGKEREKCWRTRAVIKTRHGIVWMTSSTITPRHLMEEFFFDVVVTEMCQQRCNKN